MPTFEEELKNGLIMRSIRDEQDIERYVAFQGRFFHEREPITCDLLVRHHPHMGYEDFLLVEDPQNGEIVSTVCLVPWQCRYEEVTLEVAQMESVGTHPDYRRQGLIRALIQRFHQIENERGFHFSAIGGIRYYYRRFGYTYAVDTENADILPSRTIPEPPPDSPMHHRLRPATPDDAPALHRLYEQAMGPIHFHDQRSEEIWRYLLRWSEVPARIVEDTRDHRAVGYIFATCQENDGGIRVEESAICGVETAMAVLRLLKAETDGDVSLGGPKGNLMRRLARASGALHFSHSYQWLVRISDVPHLLRSIAPVLERRLAASPHAGLSSSFRLNLFDEAFQIVFEEGRLRSVCSLGSPHTPTLRRPGRYKCLPTLLCGSSWASGTSTSWLMRGRTYGSSADSVSCSRSCSLGWTPISPCRAPTAAPCQRRRSINGRAVDDGSASGSGRHGLHGADARENLQG